MDTYSSPISNCLDKVLGCAAEWLSTMVPRQAQWKDLYAHNCIQCAWLGWWLRHTMGKQREEGMI